MTNPETDNSGQPQAPEDYLGLAVIGGSGAYDLALEEMGSRVRGEWPQVLDTPFGRAARIDILRPLEADYSLAFISRHGTGGYRISAPDVNYRANIWALKMIGTNRIVSWSGPGAIGQCYKPGDYVLPDDLIDLTRGRYETFFKGTGLGFIRQSPVFCPQLRSLLSGSLKAMGAGYHEDAVYAVTQGPRLETAAEVRMLGRLGADLVGMTLAPEVFLARELEMCYHPCCYVANRAEGVGKEQGKTHSRDPGVLFDGMLEQGERSRVEAAVKGFPALIIELARSIQQVDEKGSASSCPCRLTMERYRRSGRIGSDWRTWIKGQGDV